MDRLTVAGSGAFRSESDTEYLENNCVEEPIKLCEFKKLSGRILKTVDSVYQDVGSADECRELCLNSPFRCHSYDYGDTGEMVCRLSHHSRATLADIQVSYLLTLSDINIFTSRLLSLSHHNEFPEVNGLDVKVKSLSTEISWQL